MKSVDDLVRRILARIEERVDLDHIERVRERNRKALAWEEVAAPPLTCQTPYEGKEFQPFPYPEAFADPAKMMVNELLGGFAPPWHAVELKGDAPLCLRPNLGTGVIASMLGSPIRVLENNMPWACAVEDRERLRRMAEEPPPDASSGLGGRVIAQYEYFHKMLEGFPRCQAAFEITLPDLQGPLDTAELLWGSDIYLAFYTEREVIDALLARVVDQMLAAYSAFKPYVREHLGPGLQHQHAAAVRGHLLIRNDSAIMLSAEMYREVVAPHDARLGRELGGVGIHFCGNGRQQVENMLAMPECLCLDFGQPEMMDLDAAYAVAARYRKPLIRLQLPAEELTARRVKARFPRGVNLIHRCRSVAEASGIIERYRSQT